MKYFHNDISLNNIFHPDMDHPAMDITKNIFAQENANDVTLTLYSDDDESDAEPEDKSTNEDERLTNVLIKKRSMTMVHVLGDNL